MIHNISKYSFRDWILYIHTSNYQVLTKMDLVLGAYQAINDATHLYERDVIMLRTLGCQNQ